MYVTHREAGHSGAMVEMLIVDIRCSVAMYVALLVQPELLVEIILNVGFVIFCWGY